MPKTVHEIRRANLLQLTEDHGGREAFATRLNRTRNQIDQLLNKKQMGARLARDIEKKTGKTHGWMDHQHLDALYVADESAEYSTEKPSRKRTELLKIWGKLSPEMRDHLLAIAKTLTRKK